MESKKGHGMKKKTISYEHISRDMAIGIGVYFHNLLVRSIDQLLEWSTMAAKLPGRSDNEIKNRWNTHLKKRAHEDEMIVLENEHEGSIELDQVEQKENPNLEVLHEGEIFLEGYLESPSCSSGTELSSCWMSTSDYTVSSDVALQTSDYESTGDFWSEPFLPDITSSIDNMLSPSDLIDGYVSHDQSSCQDVTMSDEFSWSTFDSYFQYNNELVDWSF
ncbi:Homeodomain-like protein [Cynara cardunculus var. scolymus]|uniref:Homeodomain-like protein n=1 Tax=Cynara cardunculus var. scolymus TaxID=59895 RepID=A0A103Y5J5_CYNCS|nr:Homeodomain-like protein [Cynara cardunculus var. scolymus]